MARGLFLSGAANQQRSPCLGLSKQDLCWIYVLCGITPQYPVNGLKLQLQVKYKHTEKTALKRVECGQFLGSGDPHRSGEVEAGPGSLAQGSLWTTVSDTTVISLDWPLSFSGRRMCSSLPQANVSG